MYQCVEFTGREKCFSEFTKQVTEARRAAANAQGTENEAQVLADSYKLLGVIYFIIFSKQFNLINIYIYTYSAKSMIRSTSNLHD